MRACVDVEDGVHGESQTDHRILDDSLRYGRSYSSMKEG